MAKRPEPHDFLSTVETWTKLIIHTDRQTEDVPEDEDPDLNIWNEATTAGG